MEFHLFFSIVYVSNSKHSIRLEGVTQIHFLRISDWMLSPPSPQLDFFRKTCWGCELALHSWSWFEMWIHYTFVWKCWPVPEKKSFVIILEKFDYGRSLKYFSSFAAVKIGKKRVQAIICLTIVCTLFLPIFTAAKDEKYF